MGKPNFLALMGKIEIALLVQTLRRCCAHMGKYIHKQKKAHVHVNTYAHKHKKGRREGGGREFSPGAQ